MEEEKRRRRTDNHTRQIEEVSAYGETKRRGHRCTIGLEQYTVGVDRLGRILERMRSEVLPILDDGLVFEQLMIR